MTVTMDKAAWRRNAYFLDRLCDVGRHLDTWKKLCVPPAKMTESRQFDDAIELSSKLEKELVRARKLCVGPLMKSAIIYIDALESERADYEKDLLAVRAAKKKAWDKMTSSIPLFIKHKAIGPAFARYSKTEDSEENLEVYKMFLKGLKAKDMQVIWLKYVQTGDLNLPGSLVKHMRKIAEEAERTENLMEYAAIDWKKVRGEVMVNLSDTIIRFASANANAFYAWV